MLKKFQELENYNGFQVGDLMIYIKPISYSQQEFLIDNYEEFIGNPQSFFEILQDIIVNKEILDTIDGDEYMIFNLIAAICLKQDIGIEYDYYLSRALEKFEKYYDHIIKKYIESLLMFGYKYIDIKKMTQYEILECAINEIGMRKLPELVQFVLVDLSDKNTKSIEILHRITERVKVQSAKQPAQPQGKSAYDQLRDL